MNETSNTIWTWEEVNPNHSGTSGDLAKMFRNEPVKAPGVFAKDQPSPEATVMAREVIQNAWDAALEFRADEEHPPPPIRKCPSIPFEISFEFFSATGPQKNKLIHYLGLSELAVRAHGIERHSIGLRESDCLDCLYGDAPLEYLVINEKATGGMYGPWEGGKSKLYKALVTLGFTDKSGDAGGSYGYGKAGLIRGSAIRTVIAYTCFATRYDDVGVSRRLLGMTYWGQHELDGVSFTGFARFGQHQDEGVVPFENEQADKIATTLGLNARHPHQLEDQGTTMVLVQPTVHPADLVNAVERYWWPALEDPGLRFNVMVREPGGPHSPGRLLHPRPKQNKVLRTFIDGYEVATTPRDQQAQGAKDRKRSDINKIGDYSKPGTLGLVADLDGWSYAEQTESDTEVEHRSLVALMRTPRMVVEYYEVGRTPPYVRGVFVADDSINETLRATEPKGHDAWATSPEGDQQRAEAKTAEALLKRIKNNVSSYRRDLKPRPRPHETVVLPHFDKLIRRLMSGQGAAKRPIPEIRPLSINLNHGLEARDDGLIELTGTAHICFSEHFEGDHAEVKVSIRYCYVEEDRRGDAVDLIVEPPPNFEEKDDDAGWHYGTITESEVAKFKFMTNEYPTDWSGQLIVDAEIVKSDGS